MTTYSDNFNRSNGGINTGAPVTWSDAFGGTTVSNLTVSSNQYRDDGTNFAFNPHPITSAASGAPQIAQVTYKSGSGTCGVVVRANTTNGTGYAAYFNFGGTTFRLYRYSNGGSTTTELNSTSLTLAANDVISLEVSGNNLTAKVNGVTKVTATDSTYPSDTLVGILSGDGEVFLDDFSGGDLSTGVSASAAQTLGTLTQTATATVTVKANAAQTLATLTEAATATVAVKASATQTLSDFTQTALAAVTVKALAAQTLQDISAAATAIVATGPIASAALTLQDLSTAALATVTVKASADQTLATLTQAALGAITVKASAAQTLDTLVSTAAAAVTVKANASQTLQDLSTSAQVTANAGVLASADQTLDTVTVTAQGQVILSASSAMTLDSMLSAAQTLSGSGAAEVPNLGKQGGWHNRGDYANWWRRKSRRQVEQRTTEETTRQEIEDRLLGLARQAYTAIRKDKTEEAAIVAEAIAPFTAVEGLPAAAKIDWDQALETDMRDVLDALVSALTAYETRQKNDLARRLQEAADELARLEDEEIERDDHEALSLIMQHIL